MRLLMLVASLCLWWGDSGPAFAQSPQGPAGSADQAAAALPVTTFTDDPLGVRQVVLDNGLTVFISENHERPEVFGAVVVRTGAKNDPPDNTGMAHYLEHMLFKGTTELGTTNWKAEKPLQAELERLYEELRTATGERAGAIREEIAQTVKKTYRYAVPNELDQLLEHIGGTGVNAFTSYDETVYHNTFPASQVQTWLQLYAHRFQNPVFRLFPTELEAVYEEKNIALDTVGYELFRRFMKAAFPGHPYGQRDVLGEIEHLKKPSLRAMKAYYQKWYVPSNIALVLSGDVNTEEVLPMVEEAFGSWEAADPPKLRHPPVQPFEVGERLSVRLTPIRVGALAFHTVPETHPDYATLLVARRLLTNEQRSGFVDRLSDEGKLLLAMHVPADFADHNLDVIAYAPRLLTQSFRSAERAVYAQLERLQRGEFDDALFKAVKEGLLLEEQARFEDNDERALAIAHAFVTGAGWQGYLRHLQALERVSKADVTRFAKKYLGPRHLTVRSRMGFPKKTRLEKPEVPAFESSGGAHSKMFAQVQEQAQGEPKLDFVDFDEDITTIPIARGVTLHANGNPFNDIYHLELHFGVGHDRIRELQLLADYLQRIGTEPHPGLDFREELFALSTTISAYSEPERFIVRLEGPQHHMQAALALLDELLRAPKPEGKALRQLRREIWGYRRVDLEDPAFFGRALRDWVLYREHSPTLREYGPRSARRVSAPELMQAWDQVQRYALDVRYVGREKPQEVATAVKQSLPLRANLRPAMPHRAHRRHVDAQTTVYFMPRRDAVQTQLWFAVEGDPIRGNEAAAADAFSEYFGGSMAGLVFQEIREFRALAYSASGAYRRDDTPWQHGVLLGYVGCQADKTLQATDVMLSLITQMPSKPDRLDLVRSALRRSQETQSPSFRDLQDDVQDWKNRGYRRDPRRWLSAAYERLRFADIEAFYSRHLRGRPIAIMVVGDPRKVKRRDLERYGKVVRVWRRQILSP